ncbi:DUF4335 domain-containing protein [Pseudanabaena sp. PCC 6802]|uniref:DUF4335 domain-containing protein n=1 Tax=Pseudanabaena sp. PCC 6802 TaxID=118173 RepID=UPI00034C3A5C|nr:DUF4335 domain-containing protein [Pseudanabaena sp. PCC 6802]
MTIQRTYNLPNCTLLIEGIGLGSSGVLSILTNFECRFQHTSKIITGGRELLDALVKSVGQYVQDLSIGDPVVTEVLPVRLEPIGPHIHRLSVDPNRDESNNPDRNLDLQPVEISLNVVQLFDLMEGIDRLCLDPQTLTDLQLVTDTSELVIQSRVKERLVPAAMGIAGFAIAASAMFFVPVPKPQPQPQPQSQTTQVQPKASPKPPEIKDADLIKELQADLKKQIDRAWIASPSFTKPVSYRVAVNAKGEIVGYKRTNPFLPAPEEDLEKELPLKKLLVVPTAPTTGGSSTKPQPTATFRVTFEPKGTFTIKQSQ